MPQDPRVLRRRPIVVALIISLINCNHHHTASAILVNRTIDDQFGDPITGTYPTYTPAEDWQPGANCSDCSVRPDVTKAFDGTWHDSTYYPGDSLRTVTVTFSGNAVYAFFITPPVSNASLTTATYLNFTLDNELSGSFNFIPYGPDTYAYNQTVYSKTNLSNSQHTLVMSTGGSQAGLLLFDYVIYTVDTSNTTTSSGGSAKRKSSNTGAIVGGVVGGVALLAALAILTFFYRRKTAKRHSEVNPLTRELREEAQLPADLVIPYAVDDSDTQPTTTYLNSKSSRPSQHPTIFPALSSDPSTSPSNTALSHSTKALAEARQGNINRRMEAVEQQIRTQVPRSGGGEEEDWRTTAQHLRAEIGRLEVALQSQWAQGMSDQPPPEYLERPH